MTPSRIWLSLVIGGCLITQTVFATPPNTLTKNEPLLEPPPTLEQPLRFQPQLRAAAAKLAPSLQLKATSKEPGSLLKVIVTLAQPIVPGAGKIGDPAFDTLRAQHIAAAEHEFSRMAKASGFQAKRSLKFSPIVIGEVPSDTLDELAALPIVQAIEPVVKLKANRIEGAALMNADDLQTLGGTGSGVAIAIFDTGIDWEHPELPAGTKVKVGEDYTNTQTENWGIDDYGHGTSAAGIAAGLTGGMAPGAILWAIKVLDDEGNGDSGGVVDALDDVYAGRNSHGEPLRLVSFSFGGLFDDQSINYICDQDLPAMAAVLAQLEDVGVSVFASSGNDGCSDGQAFPACMSNVVSVGAVFDDDLGGLGFSGETACLPEGCTNTTTAADMIACYSNSGTYLDILAPSHFANTPTLGGGYDTQFGGTSAAAPYAAGVAAQIFGLRPNTNPADLLAAFKATGNAITDTRNGITRSRVEAVLAYQFLEGGGGAAFTYWTPVAVRSPGQSGSNWRTDISLLNRSGSIANVKLTLYANGTTYIYETTIPNSEQLFLTDVVAVLGLTKATGPLMIESDQMLRGTNRTYSISSFTCTGSFGQFYDVYTPHQTLSLNDEVWLTQLKENSDFRTNIAFTNTSGASATVSVTLYTRAGTRVGAFSVPLNPNSFYQDIQPYLSRYSTFVTGGYALIKVTSGSGILVTSSVIDWASNDATTIVGKP
ncbi:MAG: S8 family serine peptidase [bacterium]|nr:S8 family serine peptidase [bacterium]